ncbi:hypothetical protein [Pseudarthrobacter sp. B4EP4b]|nr:hypothetical protein [Pseudarthrobacter sp. B4EP4b]
MKLLIITLSHLFLGTRQEWRIGMTKLVKEKSVAADEDRWAFHLLLN